MSQQRILFVSPSADIGGAEMSLLVLLNGLDRPKYERILLVPGAGPLAERAKAIGCKVIITPVHPMTIERQLVSSITNSLRSAMDIPRLTKLLRELRPDLVHINSYRIGTPFTLAARRAGIPSVWHVRDIPESRQKKKLLARLTRLPDRVISISYAVARSIGIEQQANVVIIYNGVEMDLFGAVTPGLFRTELNLSDDKVLLCTVGQLIPLKGQDFLIRSFARLKDLPNLHLVIVGGNVSSAWADERGAQAYVQSLHRLVEEHSLSDRVTFTGFRPDIPQILVDCDLYVHATTGIEAFGRVVVEAMAAHKPVVAPNRGGVPEIVVDNETGLLFEPANEAALAQALTSMIEQRFRWPAMGDAGYQRAAALFSSERYVNAVTDLYQGLLAGAQ